MSATMRRPIVVLLPAAAALVLAAVALSVRAESPHPSFEGVWSGVFTTQDNDYWQVEDFTCFAGCTPEAYVHMQSLLDDPANDSKSVETLQGQTYAFMRSQLAKKSTPAGLALQAKSQPDNDPTLHCQAYSLVREAVDPLPIQIRQDGRNLVIRYEEWNEQRTIHMNGEPPPADLEPTPLGHSVGRYDGDALVIDTTALTPDIYFSFLSGGGYSGSARVHERYTIRDNPKRLVLDITVEDPVTLKEPYVLEKTWLWTPDVKLVEDRCKDVPGIP